MSVLRMSLVLAALAFASPAPAAVAITLGDALLARPLAAESAASMKASERYFDADALLTLGAMALAGGALAAATRRSRGDEAVLAPARSATSALRSRDAA